MDVQLVKNTMVNRPYNADKEWKNRLQQEEKAGYDEGSAGWNPIKWFNRKTPEWVTAPTAKDPQQRALQQARLRGYQKAQRDDTHTVTEMQADLAQKSPDLWNKFMDWAFGSGKGMGKDDYAREFINQEAQLLANPYSEKGRAVLENASRRIGKTFYTAGAMDRAFHNQNSVDPIDRQVGNFDAAFLKWVGGAEDLANQVVFRDAPVNLALAAGAPLLPGAKALAKAPALVRQGVIASEVAAAGAAPSAANYAGSFFGRDYGLFSGADKGAQEERASRLTYGDDVTNRMAQQQFQAVGTDQNGQPMTFQMKPTATNEELEAVLPNYTDYQQWLTTNGIPQAKMNDEASKYGYVSHVIQGGTPGTDIFTTSMFRTMTPEHKIEAFETWAMKRYLREDVDKMLVSGIKNFGNKAAMLSEAIGSDTTGVYADGFNKFLTGSDPDTILAFMEKYAGGKGGSGDTEALRNTFQNALVNAMKTDPTKTVPLLNGCLALQEAQALKDSKDPKVASKGAELVKTAFKEVLKDPESFNGMPDKDKLELLRTLEKVYSGSDGPALLGQEGDDMASSIMANLKDTAFDLAKTHPEMWPELAGIFLRYKGMSGAADIASNPWVFWAGLGTLLFGGVLALGNVFDTDENEADEEDDEDAAYQRALRRNPYA